MDEDGNIL
jgi:protein SSD1